MANLTPVTHLNLEYDSYKLLTELRSQDWGPTTYYRSPDEPTRTVDNWSMAIVKGVSPEVDRIQKIVGGEPRFFNQHAGYEVGWHIDPGKLQCGVNILLNESGPITYECGDYHYQCALIDIKRWHMIKPYHTDRILLRFGICDRTYEEALHDLAPLIRD